MNFPLTDEQLLDVMFVVLPNAAEQYRIMATKDESATDRQNIVGYAVACEALAAKYRGDANPDLTPGELATLERALRFEMTRWQQMIRPTMDDKEKAILRANAQEFADLITKLRQLRGIPQ